MDRPKIFTPAATANESNTGASPRDVAEQAISHISARRAKLVWVDVRQVVDEVCAQLAKQIEASRIETTIDVPGELGVLADRDMLVLAVTNLIVNALEAMPAGGRLVITSYCGAGGLELEVADSGPGLSDDALRRAFDPFYTTKRDGAGLGLAKVRRVAMAHGGDVVAANCPEGGAAFTLRFPARAQQSAA